MASLGLGGLVATALLAGATVCLTSGCSTIGYYARSATGHLNLVEADYVWATRKLMEIAQRRCAGRIVSVLEGGYHLDSLARSVAAHVSTLMDG